MRVDQRREPVAISLTSESLLGREAGLSNSTWLGGPVEKELAAIFQNKNEPQREDEVQTVFVDHRPNPIANEREDEARSF